MNLIMPSLDKTLVSFKKDIEKGFKEIFMTYSEACSNYNNDFTLSFENFIRHSKGQIYRI